MISVAKRPRPSLRAKIGVHTPGINRHKNIMTIKKNLTWKQTKKKNGIFCFHAEFFFLPSWCVYAGCVYADFRPVRRMRFLDDRYHFFFAGKTLRKKATYKFYISDVFCPDWIFLFFFILEKSWCFVFLEEILTTQTWRKPKNSHIYKSKNVLFSSYSLRTMHNSMLFSSKLSSLAGGFLVKNGFGV